MRLATHELDPRILRALGELTRPGLEAARRMIIRCGKNLVPNPPMLDAHPTLIIEEAAGPETDSGDLVLVDGHLYAIRRALSTGRGRIRCDLKDGQSWRATWGDSGGPTMSGRFYLASGTGSDDHLTAPPGKVLAAVTQDLTLSGIPAGTAIEADGADFTVLGSAPWAPGWTRLALRVD